MENQENKKDFDLGAILQITTGRLFTGFEDLYDVLKYLTGDSIYSHQIPRVLNAARLYVLSLYPKLAGVGDDVAINSFDDAQAFIDEQKKVFGDSLPLRPMPKTAGYSYIDPIKEAIDIKSGRHM